MVETNRPIRKIVGTPTNKRLAAKPKLVVSITEVFTQNNFYWNKLYIPSAEKPGFESKSLRICNLPKNNESILLFYLFEFE